MATPKKAAAPKPATETPPQTPAAAPAAEAPPVETPPKEEPKPAPTPEEIQERVDSIFAPVNSAVNAKIQGEREKQAREGVIEDQAVAAFVEEKDLPQSDAPGGGEKVEGSEQPAEEPPADSEEEPPKGGTPNPERFVPGGPSLEEVEAAARAAVRDEFESRQPEPTPSVPHGTQDEAGLSDAAQDQLVVLKKMAALNSAHRDLPERQKKFWKAEEKYRAQWEQANQGQPFDSNAADHAAFYQKNEPFVPMRDFKAAERAIIADEAEERAVQRVRKEQEPRLREMELKEREREAAPHVTNAAADAAEAIFAAVPEFKAAFKPGKLSAAEVEKMEEMNPALAQIAREEAEVTAVLVGELEKLDRMQGHYQPNPAKQHRLSNGQLIQPHAVLEVEFAETEAAFLAKPAAEQVRDGKKLITFEQAMLRAQRIQSDPKLRPDQKQRALEDLSKNNWWVQSGDVARHIRAKKAARVGSFAERFAKMTQAAPKTGTVNGQQTNGAPKEAPKPAQVAVKPSGKAGLTRGTSTASSSDVSDNAPKGQSEAQKARENLAKMAFP